MGWLRKEQGSDHHTGIIYRCDALSFGLMTTWELIDLIVTHNSEYGWS
jgi:hypothetical protein